MSFFGIIVFVAFSLGLGWFMRFEPTKPRKLPSGIGEWQRRGPRTDTSEPAYLEQRLWLYEGTGLRRHRLVEQGRVRAEADGRILHTLPERLVERWRGTIER